MTRFERDLNTFMAVAHEVALTEAYDTRTTPEVRRHARALASFAQDQLAADAVPLVFGRPVGGVAQRVGAIVELVGEVEGVGSGEGLARVRCEDQALPGGALG